MLPNTTRALDARSCAAPRTNGQPSSFTHHAMRGASGHASGSRGVSRRWPIGIRGTARVRVSADQARPDPAPWILLQPLRRRRYTRLTGVREGHSSGSIVVRRRCCGRSPLCHWPESFVGMHVAAATFTVGGSRLLHFSECWATKRSWVPESFRGSCSFGGQQAGSLPLIAKVNLPWFVAELCCSGGDQTPTDSPAGTVLSSASAFSTVTLVPTGTRRCRSMISWLNMRMHPLETEWPIVSGSFVPWMR